MHEERIEPDKVAGQPNPQQVTVDAFQLEQDSADITGAAGDFDPCGFFNSLTVTRTVNAPSYAADALGDVRHLLVSQLGICQFLHTPMTVKAAVVHADNLFTVHE